MLVLLKSLITRAVYYLLIRYFIFLKFYVKTNSLHKTGKIVLFNKTSGESLGTFLDISTIVLVSGEQGLLGLALHPNYTTNGKIFIFYTCNQQNCPITCTSNDTCLSGNCFNGFCTIKNSDEPIQSISYIAELTVTSSNDNNVNASTLRNLLRIENPYANNQVSN